VPANSTHADYDAALPGWIDKKLLLGAPRVLSAARVIYRPYFDEKLREVRTGLGYGKPTKEQPDLKPWVPDVLRHTAISHYFRATASYGRTAEQFG